MTTVIYSSLDHPEWKHLPSPVSLFDFTGEFPDKFVQPYATWRRNTEAASPGEALTEPALICTAFRPRIARSLVQTSYVANALAFLRAPDAYALATITYALARHTEHTIRFVDALASAREIVRAPLPFNPRPQLDSKTIAARAWNHLHLVLEYQEASPIARAAEAAGLYVPIRSEG